MSNEFVNYETEGRVAVLTFNRPESRNAIASFSDAEEIIAAFERAQQDANISCIILTGEGTAFSAGGDLRGMKEKSGNTRAPRPVDTRNNYKSGIHRAIKAMWECEVPMIAAINGHAIGLGLDVACLCDIRLGASTAKFASSFIKVGIVPGDGGSWILGRVIGVSRASELILTGDTYDAGKALEYGLISRVVEPEKLLDEAKAMAARITCNPAKVLRMSKRLLRDAQHMRLSDTLELAAAFQSLAHETDDHEEAVTAFLEKRAPEFPGS